MRILTLLPVIVALAGGAGAPPAFLRAEDQAQQPFQISVNVDLVVLPITVRDRKGGFAADLREQDFDVHEDGVRQAIRLFRHDDIPITVGLVVDHSGSMLNKMADVLAAAQTFVRSSNASDQMFVVNFNEHATLGLPAAIPFANNPDDLATAILKAPVAGQTALYDALDMALDRLRAGDREKKVLIVISDGGDNASVLALPRILKKAVESGAIVYTIGIFDHDDPDQNPGVLRQLARETGGEAFFPVQFDDAIAICEGIARDIRHQYTIGYVSANTPKAGAYRAVRVTARAAGKDLVVRTRAGYIAGGAAK
jgi:Ca-activated chloride channel family protein